MMIHGWPAALHATTITIYPSRLVASSVAHSSSTISSHLRSAGALLPPSLCCTFSSSSSFRPWSLPSPALQSTPSSSSTPSQSSALTSSKLAPSSSSSLPSALPQLSSSSPQSSSSLSSLRASSPSPLPSRPSLSPSIAAQRQDDTCSNDNGSESLMASENSRQENALPLSEDLPEKGFWESKLVARILLLLVPVFWGTYGPAIRYVYEQPDAPSSSTLTLARKALSLVFFFCVLPFEASEYPWEQSIEELGSDKQDSIDVERGKVSIPNQLLRFLTDHLGIEWFAAMELGLWTFLGTACQTDGLENTTATRAGFLLQSVTVLVPVLSTFSGVKVKPVTWAATVLALLGVTSMGVQLQHNVSELIPWSRVSSIEFSRGDWEMLLAAFFYALCTVRLGEYAARARAVRLSTNLMVVSTMLAAAWVLLDHAGGAFPTEWQWRISPNTVWAMVFSALVPGTLASLGQTIGQKSISAAEAQVYFSLQPFYSAVFAAGILKEKIDGTTWVAGTVLVVAAMLASVDSLGAAKE